MRVVTCPDWSLGPGASLRCGLSALGDDVDAALIVLADGPARPARGRAADRAPRRCRPRRRELRRHARHPAVLSRAAWSSIPDEGARALQRARPLRRPRAAGRHGLPASAAARRRPARALCKGCRSSASFAISSGGIGSSTATLTKRRRSTSKRYRFSATRALGEVIPRLLHLVVGQDSVEVRLHHRLAVTTTTRHLQFTTILSAMFCLSARRPRWSRDMTVPIGMSRICAASAYENSPMSTSTSTSRKSCGTSASASTTEFCEALDHALLRRFSSAIDDSSLL